MSHSKGVHPHARRPVHEIPPVLEPAVGHHAAGDNGTGWWGKFHRLILGAPKKLSDRAIFHRMALIPLLAWVGMGADGLSSSSYGPEESFRVLGQHLYLAPLVVLAIVLTIAVISIAYSRVIEHFPNGGGGYVIASKLLGPVPGVVSGCSLIVDYVLTITVSIAAGGDALFSLAPPAWQAYKLPVELFFGATLLLLNLRGVKESVLAVAPIFFVFVISHLAIILGSFFLFHGRIPETVQFVSGGVSQGAATLGAWGLCLVLFKSYSMGAGTYTGIEAVSNGMATLREPRVESGRRTMLYMAVSLSVAAGGLFLCYLLAGIGPLPGQTMNAVLAGAVFGNPSFPMGGWKPLWMGAALVSEAGLLLIAAQTGFIDGPRVVANMALDSWFPKRFSALSERFTVQNGVLLFGLASLAALWLSRGDTGFLVVMYSINVFITFSLTEISMMTLYWRQRVENPHWIGKIYIHVVGFILCASILVLMLAEKFFLGGWLTLSLTSGLILLCFWIRGYYRMMGERICRLDEQLSRLPLGRAKPPRRMEADASTAVLLVNGYSGVGIHTFLSIFKVYFPGQFQNAVFVSAGEVDSGTFKGNAALDHLRQKVREDLLKYVRMAAQLGIPARYEMGIGTDPVETAGDLCLKAARKFRKSVVFAGRLVFRRMAWYQGFMHNQTAYAIQDRLQWEGIPMTILPVRVL